MILYTQNNVKEAVKNCTKITLQYLYGFPGVQSTAHTCTAFTSLKFIITLYFVHMRLFFLYIRLFLHSFSLFALVSHCIKELIQKLFVEFLESYCCRLSNN